MYALGGGEAVSSSYLTVCVMSDKSAEKMKRLGT